MNLFKNISLLLLSLVFFSSCETLLMKPNPETDNLSVFDEYATLVTEKYAMLEVKGVDIAPLTDSLRRTITGDLSEQELFDKLAVITLKLRDAHSNLIGSDPNSVTENTPFAGFDLLDGFDPGIDFGILFNNYVSKDVNPELEVLEGGAFGFRVMYGSLPQDREIGYIWIPSWNDEITDEEIEKIFSSIKDYKGLIFDMRLNGGGDPSLATKFASYFIDEPVYTGFERFKTGPGPNDFSDSDVTLQPASSSNKFLKPVAVLIDRNVYSASTTFSYSVFPVPRMTFIGQTAGGGSGSVADGYLANGWYWSLSTSEFIDAQGRHLDDGFEPDIAVALDTTTKSIDEVIERAILELQ